MEKFYKRLLTIDSWLQVENFKTLSMHTKESCAERLEELLNSLFRVPMSFYDSMPLGRILSRVSADLSIVDLDVPFSFVYSFSSTINTYANLAVLAVVTWQVLIISIPMIYLAILLQKLVSLV
ncbi:ABC transporter C family member 10 [Camellia lanceoleosa]|uniref:ABC transporter C family member 10 n=1 Tax=Camellia lanceoleosa TaxID=1840588 RepID=A0ACC0H7Z1_9ERIC|nr:ABC transporter C family member 10 [Camellia lanceoleosa]